MEFVLAGLIVVYLMPWVIAEGLRHPRANAIMWLVLLGAWTAVGWVAALLWALRARPRRRPPPTLALVGRDPLPPPGGPWPARLRAGLGALAGVAVAGSLVALDAGPPPRLPASGVVEPGHGRLVLRMGPHRAWPAVGEARAPCRLELLEREGAWRHVWRLDPCPGTMRGRSGWARIEDLREVARRDPDRTRVAGTGALP